MMIPDRGDDEAMRTTCPTCDTVYVVPDDRIGPKGRKVRCTRCDEEWRVFLAADPVAPKTFAEPPPPVEDPSTDEDAFASEFDGSDETHAPDPDPFDAFDTPHPADADPDPVVDEAVEPEAENGASSAAQEETPPRLPEKAAARTPPRHRRHLHLHLPQMPRPLRRAAPFFGPAVFVAACAAVAAFFVLRAPIVARVPALAGLYRMVGLDVNLRGIVFGSIETLRETEEGKPVLVIEGSLANTTGEMRDVPALRFALRDGDAQELYAWSVDPRASVIAAGDQLRFRTRLVAPPDRAVDLQIRFAERRNRQAGLP